MITPHWSIALLLESADEYEPRKVQKKMEEISLSLAKQAFWLELFRVLEFFEKEVEGVALTHERRAARMLLIKPFESTSPKKVEAAQNKLSKVRGKFLLAQADLLHDHLKRVSTRGEVVRLEDKEKWLLKAWGVDLFSQWKAKQESRELEKVVPENMAKISDGGSGKKRL